MREAVLRHLRIIGVHDPKPLAQAVNEKNALSFVASSHPGLVIVDWRMAESRGLVEALLALEDREEDNEGFSVLILAPSYTLVTPDEVTFTSTLTRKVDFIECNEGELEVGVFEQKVEELMPRKALSASA